MLGCWVLTPAVGRVDLGARLLHEEAERVQALAWVGVRLGVLGC